MPVLALTALFLLSANLCQAQIVDPDQSYFEILGDVNLVTVANGGGDPLGDLGIVVHCYDALGQPISGIPGSAFRIVALSGDMVEFGFPVLAADTTDALGRILLTEPLQASATIIHGSIAVSVDGTNIVNGGSTIPVEFRTPDLNHDGIVNISDMVPFAQAFDCCDGSNECLRSDFNGDGCVSLADVVIFADHMGSSPLALTRRPLKANKIVLDDVFVGCIARDFDEDDGPTIIREEVVLPAGGFVTLKLLAKDFACMSGVDFAFRLPSGLVEVGMTAIGPFENLLRPPPPPGGTRATLTAPYITDGPVFICEVQLFSAEGGTFNINDIYFVHVVLTDCMYPPTEVVGCVGTATPCEMSRIFQDSDQYIACPGGDLSQPDIVTVVMRDQDGNGILGLSAADFEIYLTDDLGGDRGDTFKLTVDQFPPFTDVNGELDFRFEPRGTCRWPDACMDLNIRIVYEGCSLEINKLVQTLNIVRYDPADGPDDLIDDDDIAAWTAALYTEDICLYLVRSFRTPVVTHAALNIVKAHYLDGCSVSDVPDLAGVGTVLLHQNTPNPFNPSTEIQLTLPADAGQADLTIYDLKGRVIRRLWQGPLPQGMSRFTWDGRDADNRSVGSGVYFVQLRALGEKSSMRMLLLK